MSRCAKSRAWTDAFRITAARSFVTVCFLIETSHQCLRWLLPSWKSVTVITLARPEAAMAPVAARWCPEAVPEMSQRHGPTSSRWLRARERERAENEGIVPFLSSWSPNSSARFLSNCVSWATRDTHTHTLTHNKPGLTACSALPCTTHIFPHTHVPPAVILLTTTLSSHRLWVKLTPVICLSWSFSHLSFFASVCFVFPTKVSD